MILILAKPCVRPVIHWSFSWKEETTFFGSVSAAIKISMYDADVTVKKSDTS